MLVQTNDRREEDQERYAKDLEAERQLLARAQSGLDAARKENLENRRRFTDEVQRVREAARRTKKELEGLLKTLVEENAEVIEENNQLIKENDEFRERLGEGEGGREEEGPAEGVE